MEIQKNKFKAALAAGQLQRGLWSSLCSPIVAEILSHSGFDWILFDGEHAPSEISDQQPLLQAAAGGTATSVVRPAWNDAVMIKRVLDIGAQSVLLPFVQTPEEAQNAVRACRYPPDGIRGVGGMHRASAYGRIQNYAQDANDEICILVQVETREAMGRISEIASIDGVDGVFIGPADLSASMGHLGNPAHPDVQDVIKQAAQKILAAGKAPGILATTAVDAKRYIDWGFLFVACGMDLKLLVKGADDLLTAVS